MPPGVHVRTKLFRSLVCVLAAAIIFGLAAQIRFSVDVTEDQRNSFPVADQRMLAKLAEPLVVTVHLAAEDPRYADLKRNVLAKLDRAMPNVSVRLAGGRQTPATNSGSDSYGEVEYPRGFPYYDALLTIAGNEQLSCSELTGFRS